MGQMIQNAAFILSVILLAVLNDTPSSTETGANRPYEYNLPVGMDKMLRHTANRKEKGVTSNAVTPLFYLVGAE